MAALGVPMWTFKDDFGRFFIKVTEPYVATLMRSLRLAIGHHYALQTCEGPRTFGGSD